MRLAEVIHVPLTSTCCLDLRVQLRLFLTEIPHGVQEGRLECRLYNGIGDLLQLTEVPAYNIKRSEYNASLWLKITYAIRSLKALRRCAKSLCRRSINLPGDTKMNGVRLYRAHRSYLAQQSKISASQPLPARLSSQDRLSSRCSQQHGSGRPRCS